MTRRDAFNLCSVLLCLMAAAILWTIMWNKSDYIDWKKRFIDMWSNSNVGQGENVLIAQRNNLSKLLNQKQQIIGRLKCEELNRTKVAMEETTDAGGWCPIASKTKHLGFNKSFAAELAEFFRGKNIASFGDGPGRFKSAILDTGLVKTYDAYDGAPFCEITSNGLVQFLDLSLPQFGLPVYDWILCLEVAEHIPKAYEKVLISNIVRHAREGVILSWARPGQKGYSHINNQSPEYVISCMDRLGFEVHTKFTDKIRSGTINRNLKRNINVFVRKEKQSKVELSYNA
ncbi:uncharacterized protein LOC132731410 [Ruditapes philippinarum]|uniref:uncharacterized protein LOC132731410 n=1 Tax=Ruditapes philippinarum TaxID=129788 RepID=UPI00295B23E0|nr:uncharacterized protein LOC132731410 [Ruditapes philippinarum]